LDFITNAGTNFSNISDLKIDQANLGATGTVSVSVAVASAATQAQVDVTAIPVAIAGVAATDDLALSNTVTQSVHDITFGTAADITLTAEALGDAGGAAGNTFSGITLVQGAAPGTTSYNATTGLLTVEIDFAGGDTLVSDVVAAINAGTDFNAVANAGGGEAIVLGALTLTDNTETTTGQSAGSATLSVTAEQTGTAANGITATIIEDGAIAANTAVASLNAGNIEVRVNGTVAYSDIRDAINDDIDGYVAALSSPTGSQFYISSADTAPGGATLAGGIDAAGGIAEAVVLELAGTTGSEVLSFGAGTSIADLAAGINLVSDATGVEATVNGTTLELQSTTYGSNSLVDLRVITEGTGNPSSGTFTTAVGQGDRSVGVDIVASVNGVSATGIGNQLSINTATLDFSATIAAGFTGTAEFDITGGGALFQLGPDVVSNQQARLGIGSVNTARLGGVSGKLFQLGNGNVSSLANDPNVAASIVAEAIDQVTSLRGRLGAFQRTTLETNKNALNDTLVNLSDSESSIRDADFAVESANLTRAQILVQSGTTVLQIANQNPQNVLALLR
jgi:flagellin